MYLARVTRPPFSYARLAAGPWDTLGYKHSLDRTGFPQKCPLSPLASLTVSSKGALGSMPGHQAMQDPEP